MVCKSTQCALLLYQKEELPADHEKAVGDNSDSITLPVISELELACGCSIFSTA